MKTKDQIKIGGEYTMKRRVGELPQRVTVLRFLPGSIRVVNVSINGISEAEFGKENAEAVVHIRHLTAAAPEALKSLFQANNKNLTMFEQ